MNIKLIQEAFELIHTLSQWETIMESEWEETGDDYIDNTMTDIDELIKKSRDIMQAKNGVL
jgi:hypothetical protein